MALELRPSVPLGLWLLVLARLCTEAADGGGWRQAGPGPDVAVEECCTVELRSDLTYAEFVQHYAFLRPVILQGLTDNSVSAEAHCRQLALPAQP